MEGGGPVPVLQRDADEAFAPHKLEAQPPRVGVQGFGGAPNGDDGNLPPPGAAQQEVQAATLRGDQAWGGGDPQK